MAVGSSFTIVDNSNEQYNQIPTFSPVGDLLQSKYNFDYLVFPSDLGMNDNGHYMVININAPTKFLSREYAGQFTNNKDFFTPLDPDERSTVDRLRGLTGVAPVSSPATDLGGKLIDGAKELLGVQQSSGTGGYGDVNNKPANNPVVSLPRSTRRVSEAIALHMPTPLIFNHQNVFEEISLTAVAGRIGTGVVATLASLAAAFKSVAAGAAASQKSRGLIDGLGNGVGVLSTIAQNPINPAVEVLFSTSLTRSFTFEFLMAPRNEEESIAMKKIIRTLRFHSAPEINAGTYGLTWIPPAEFDIMFFNKGAEQQHLIRINTCVMERIEVDYAPASGTYATFRNGHPVAARLSLGFREVVPPHKDFIARGF